MTQDKSRVRERCMPGSVRGAAREGRPYRDRRNAEAGRSLQACCMETAVVT
ncbi:MAG TPA: hypothetical protein VJ124_18240 [Pyrinomonadaceae bacterium]|nr:hypothetical protein [Pyrinomonadaceae bacterium]